MRALMAQILTQAMETAMGLRLMPTRRTTTLATRPGGLVRAMAPEADGGTDSRLADYSPACGMIDLIGMDCCCMDCFEFA